MHLEKDYLHKIKKVVGNVLETNKQTKMRNVYLHGHYLSSWRMIKDDIKQEVNEKHWKQNDLHYIHHGKKEWRKQSEWWLVTGERNWF